MKLPPSSPRFLRLGGVPLLLVGAGLLFPQGATAQTSYWKGAVTANFTNPANWDSGIVPTASMTAAVSNRSTTATIDFTIDVTNAGADFNYKKNSTQTLNISNSTWWVTNFFNVGTTPGWTGSVTMSKGNLVVTNSNGTAQMTVGGAGFGVLILDGGNTVLDRLVATNAVVSTDKPSDIQFKGGTLTTLHGTTMILASNSSLTIGMTSGQEATWCMFGGTNVITYAGSSSSKIIKVGGTSSSGITATGTVVVAGSGTIWSNVVGDSGRVDLSIAGISSGTGRLVVSNNASVFVPGHLDFIGTNGQVTLASGGRMIANVDGNAAMKGFANTLIVSNENSKLTTINYFIGDNASSNRWIIAEGGQIQVASGTLTLGRGTNSVGNSIQISGTSPNGTNSQLTLSGNLEIDSAGSSSGTAQSNFVVVANGGIISSSLDIDVGQYGSGAQLLVTNGGLVTARSIRMGVSSNAAYGYTLLDGPNTVASLAYFMVGTNSYVGVGTGQGKGRALIQNGAVLEITSGSGNGLYAGIDGQGVISNLGGVFRFLSANPAISNYAQSTIVLSNGTVAFRNVGAAEVLGNITNLAYRGTNTLRLDSSTNVTLGAYTFSNNLAFSTLSLLGNSAWQSTNLFIGAGGSLLVSNANATVASPLASGVLTNLGSITVASSTVGYSQQVYVVGSYISRDSTNSFGRGLLVETGATYNLLGLSLALGSVTNKGQFSVDNGAVYRPSSGAVNPGGGTLNIGGSGWLDLTNGSFTVSGGVTNNGVISVNNANATFQNAVVVSGGYRSDPSTNTFNDNLTLLSTGYIAAASNDLYVFGKDLIIQSTNKAAFNMVQARALFTSNGSGTFSHTLNLTNSSAFDYGSNILDIAHMVTNFGIGTLSLASNNTLTLTGVKSGGTTNALYVGWLDLQAIEAAGYNAANSLGALTNALVTVLSLPNINLYYDKNVAQNAYLGGLEFDLWGAGSGLLIPIPEPSPFLAAGAGLALLAFLRRRA